MPVAVHEIKKHGTLRSLNVTEPSFLRDELNAILLTNCYAINFPLV
jgi:hypothetical protein